MKVGRVAICHPPDFIFFYFKRLNHMNWISRNAAAKQLGVKPQTISNFLESGFITGRKINGQTQVNEESLEIFIRACPNYAQRMEEIDRLESQIKAKEISLKKKSKELDRKMEYLDAEDDNVLNVRQILTPIVLRSNSPRNKYLELYLNGESLESMSDLMGITRTRIRYVFMKIVKDSIESTVESINSLTLENMRLRLEIERLKSKKYENRNKKYKK